MDIKTKCQGKPCDSCLDLSLNTKNVNLIFRITKSWTDKNTNIAIPGAFNYYLLVLKATKGTTLYL